MAIALFKQQKLLYVLAPSDLLLQWESISKFFFLSRNKKLIKYKSFECLSLLTISLEYWTWCLCSSYSFKCFFFAMQIFLCHLWFEQNVDQMATTTPFVYLHPVYSIYSSSNIRVVTEVLAKMFIFEKKAASQKKILFVKNYYQKSCYFNQYLTNISKKVVWKFHQFSRLRLNFLTVSGKKSFKVFRADYSLKKSY